MLVIEEADVADAPQPHGRTEVRTAPRRTEVRVERLPQVERRREVIIQREPTIETRRAVTVRPVPRVELKREIHVEVAPRVEVQRPGLQRPLGQGRRIILRVPAEAPTTQSAPRPQLRGLRVERATPADGASGARESLRELIQGVLGHLRIADEIEPSAEPPTPAVVIDEALEI